MAYGCEPLEVPLAQESRNCFPLLPAKVYPSDAGQNAVNGPGSGKLERTLNQNCDPDSTAAPQRKQKSRREQQGAIRKTLAVLLGSQAEPGGEEGEGD